MSFNSIWYVEPLDPPTNKVIAGMLPEENACPGMLCSDEKERDLWRCEAHSQVAQLERAQESLKIQFNVFIQDGEHRQIRPWKFAKKAPQRMVKAETYRASAQRIWQAAANPEV